MQKNGDQKCLRLTCCHVLADYPWQGNVEACSGCTSAASALRCIITTRPPDSLSLSLSLSQLDKHKRPPSNGRERKLSFYPPPLFHKPIKEDPTDCATSLLPILRFICSSSSSSLSSFFLSSGLYTFSKVFSTARALACTGKDVAGHQSSFVKRR